MIVLICTMEPGRIPWLPQFVEHYRGQGVERFVLSLQLEPDADPAVKDRDYQLFMETLAGLGIHEGRRWESVFGAPEIMRNQRTIQAELSPDDWIVWCDSDEYQVYPSPLPALTRQCAGLGVDFVRGVLIDRVAQDGSLAPFDARTPIWQTYPRTCNITSALAAGDLRKVVVAHGRVQLHGGKHTVRKGEHLKTIAGCVQVHHFKWDAGVIERLRYRVTPQWRAKFVWWVESQRLLDYFMANDLRFRPEDLRPITLNGPHLVDFG